MIPPFLDKTMADKKVTPYASEAGASQPKFKLPTYEKTNPEGEAASGRPATPNKSNPTTNVTPYGKA
jgi:hypothetical protein